MMGMMCGVRMESKRSATNRSLSLPENCSGWGCVEEDEECDDDDDE